MGPNAQSTGLQGPPPTTATGGPGGGQPPQQNPPDKKDGWDKAEIIAASLVPVMLFFGSFWVSRSVQKAETAAKMVELGAEILRMKPDESPEPLRNWALDLIDRYADPKLPPEARDVLLKRGLRGGTRASKSVQFEATTNSLTTVPLLKQTFELLVTEIHQQPDGRHLVSFAITSEQQSSHFKSVGPGYILTFGEAHLEVLEVGEKSAKFLASSTP